METKVAMRVCLQYDICWKLLQYQELLLCVQNSNAITNRFCE